MFGSNFLSFDIRPSPEGGLTKGTKAELRFKDRGMFEFVNTLEKVRERAVYMKREEEAEQDALRASLLNCFNGSLSHIMCAAAYASSSATPTPHQAPLPGSATAGPVPNEAPPGYEASI